MVNLPAKLDERAAAMDKAKQGFDATAAKAKVLVDERNTLIHAMVDRYVSEQGVSESVISKKELADRLLESLLAAKPMPN